MSQYLIFVREKKIYYSVIEAYTTIKKIDISKIQKIILVTIIWSLIPVLDKISLIKARKIPPVYWTYEKNQIKRFSFNPLEQKIKILA